MSARRAALTRLLRPKTIAVVGGGAWARNVVNEAQNIGFKGDIWPVHPSRDQIAGQRAFASVNDLPKAPDATFIGVNRHATLDVLRGLDARGAGGAVCFASGFAEADAELGGSADLQTALLDAAGEVALLGPNCYGFLNYLDGAALWPDQHGGVRAQSGAALITQSSNIAINLTMQTRGLPLSYVITAGNQAQTDLAEIAQTVLEDPRVTCLGLHIEGIQDINALEALSRASHDLKKPICVLKIGRSEAAQLATLSHTASLAGSSAGANALLARLGFASVTSLAVMLELLKIWHVAGPLSGTRIASASCSGGEASLIADVGADKGLSFPALQADQKRDLRAVLGPAVALANPLDYHTYIWPDVDKMAATYAAAFAGPIDLGVVILDFPRPDRCDGAEWHHVVTALEQAKAHTTTPLALLASLPETMPETVAADLMAKGVIPFCGLDDACAAIAAACVPLRGEAPLWPVPEGPALAGSALSEAEAKTRLAEAGLDVPRAQVARSLDDLADAAAAVPAPWVLKGSGTAHKSEAGGVVLGLSDLAGLSQAAKTMNMAPYLVEELIDGTIFEALLSVTLDPAHGYVLTFGAGGTRTELLQDTVSALLPVTRAEFDTLLDGLRHRPVLKGYRAAPGCDMDAIWSAVAALQGFVQKAQGRVTEVEINPLICTTDRAIVADALIVTAPIEGDT